MTAIQPGDAAFDALILARLRRATGTAPPDAATAAAAAWCTALVEASFDHLEVHDFLSYGKGARAAERTVDATLTDHAGVLRSRGVTDAEELAVFLIGDVTALTDLAILRRETITLGFWEWSRGSS